MSTPQPAARPAPPPRPAWSEERPAAWLFRALGPRLRRVPQPAPPAELRPFEERGAGATLPPLLALEARLLHRLGRPADARRLAGLAARLARARGSGSGLDFLL